MRELSVSGSVARARPLRNAPVRLSQILPLERGLFSLDQRLYAGVSYHNKQLVLFEADSRNQITLRASVPLPKTPLRLAVCDADDDGQQDALIGDLLHASHIYLAAEQFACPHPLSDFPSLAPFSGYAFGELTAADGRRFRYGYSEQVDGLLIQSCEQAVWSNCAAFSLDASEILACERPGRSGLFLALESGHTITVLEGDEFGFAIRSTTNFPLSLYLLDMKDLFADGAPELLLSFYLTSANSPLSLASGDAPAIAPGANSSVDAIAGIYETREAVLSPLVTLPFQQGCSGFGAGALAASPRGHLIAVLLSRGRDCLAVYSQASAGAFTQ